MVYKCDICRDTGIEFFTTAEGAVCARDCKCGILQREQMRRKLSFANIPEAFMGMHLTNYRLDIYTMDTSRRIMKGNLKAVSYWLDNFDEMRSKGLGLYMYSVTKGSGKIRLALSIANELITRYAVSVKFATSVDILNEIRASWDKNTEVNEHKLLADLTMVDVLIIDDFGIEVPKDWSMERFYQIVNSRYMHKKITIYTSNSSIDNLMYDDRITNRIEEQTFQLRFPQESVRKIIRENHQAELKQIMMGEGDV